MPARFSLKIAVLALLGTMADASKLAARLRGRARANASTANDKMRCRVEITLPTLTQGEKVHDTTWIRPAGGAAGRVVRDAT